MDGQDRVRSTPATTPFGTHSLPNEGPSNAELQANARPTRETHGHAGITKRNFGCLPYKKRAQSKGKKKEVGHWESEITDAALPEEETPPQNSTSLS